MLQLSCHNFSTRLNIKYKLFYVIFRKDLLLPAELQKALAAEASGRRIARGKVIEAEGEIKTAEHLKEAAGLMQGNPNVLWVSNLCF